MSKEPPKRTPLRKKQFLRDLKKLAGDEKKSIREKAEKAEVKRLRRKAKKTAPPERSPKEFLVRPEDLESLSDEEILKRIRKPRKGKK